MVLVVMKIKQTIKIFVMAVTVVSGVVFANTSPALATSKCGGVDTAIISCSQDNSGSSVTNNAVWGLLLMVINVLTAGIGIAAVGGLIYGGIMWSSAGGNPGQVQKARQIITNVVIGIIAYALMYSFLNFLVPGGIFNK